ncbi:MAG: hypothetical protein K1X75_08215 [Leptospirales bacterium]|nr:hypothetical protein [Leptospirales bacterium]
MIIALLISQALLWILLGVLAFTALALARQIGVLHERIAPAGALSTRGGPQGGQPAPAISGQHPDGAAVEWQWPLRAGQSELLLFVSPECPLCKEILPVAKRLAAQERNLRLLLVGEGRLEEYRDLARLFKIDEASVCLSNMAATQYQVGKLPHAVLIDGEGRFVAGGLSNTREHLDSLLNARDHGSPSIQEYLQKHNGQRELSAGGLDR